MILTQSTFYERLLSVTTSINEIINLQRQIQMIYNLFRLDEYEYDVVGNQPHYIGPGAHNDRIVHIQGDLAKTAAAQMMSDGKRSCRRKGCSICKKQNNKNKAVQVNKITITSHDALKQSNPYGI